MPLIWKKPIIMIIIAGFDGSFGASTLNLDNGECLANIFTVSGNPSGREQLKAISFAPLYSGCLLQHPGLQKPRSAGEPESGTAMFSSKQYGSTTYSGYYPIPLKTPAGLPGR